MFTLPLSILKYSFSCDFLWFILSLFLYLDEEIAKEDDIGRLGLKWNKLSEDLAQWAIEEGYFPLKNDSITEEDKKTLSLIGGELGNSLMFHFADTLHSIAIDSYVKNPLFGESIWLYYYYCRFLWQVLREFDQIMQESGHSSVYYKRYQESTGLFQDMAAAMEHERPFLDNQEGIDEDTVHSIWAEIDNFAIKLGNEWRQTVLEAAHNQKLPDFMNENDM